MLTPLLQNIDFCQHFILYKRNCFESLELTKLYKFLSTYFVSEQDIPQLPARLVAYEGKTLTKWYNLNKEEKHFF